ncbi:hypothetical protein LCGC14_1670040 [marine sediment metagenome]|uniref:Uncharacterized protein n=1 Tax=marine sediment metagenome TaxID=412755 RepID=A0A0F9HSJ3_9ZZZZ
MKQIPGKIIKEIELEPDCFIYDAGTGEYFLKYKIKKEVIYS